MSAWTQGLVPTRDSKALQWFLAQTPERTQKVDPLRGVPIKYVPFC